MSNQIQSCDFSRPQYIATLLPLQSTDTSVPQTISFVVPNKESNQNPKIIATAQTLVNYLNAQIQNFGIGQLLTTDDLVYEASKYTNAKGTELPCLKAGGAVTLDLSALTDLSIRQTVIASLNSIGLANDGSDASATDCYTHAPTSKPKTAVAVSASMGSGLLGRTSPTSMASTSAPQIEIRQFWGIFETSLIVDGKTIVEDAHSIQDVGNGLFLVVDVIHTQIIDSTGAVQVSWRSSLGAGVHYYAKNKCVTFDQDGALTVFNVENKKTTSITKDTSFQVSFKEVIRSGDQWLVRVRGIRMSEDGQSQVAETEYLYDGTSEKATQIKLFRDPIIDIQKSEDGRFLVQNGQGIYYRYDHGQFVPISNGRLAVTEACITSVGYDVYYITPLSISVDYKYRKDSITEPKLRIKIAQEIARLRAKISAVHFASTEDVDLYLECIGAEKYPLKREDNWKAQYESKLQRALDDLENCMRKADGQAVTHLGKDGRKLQS